MIETNYGGVRVRWTMKEWNKIRKIKDDPDRNPPDRKQKYPSRMQVELNREATDRLRDYIFSLKTNGDIATGSGIVSAAVINYLGDKNV